jgi:hypothetical protein
LKVTPVEVVTDAPPIYPAVLEELLGGHYEIGIDVPVRRR